MTNTLKGSIDLLNHLSGNKTYGHWRASILKDHLSPEMNNIITSYGVEKLTNEDLEQIIKLAEVLL
jgi:hypothetical protein